METFKRRFVRGFWFALALIFLFESWLWDHVKEWLRALGRSLGVARFEARLMDFIARLSPRATLAVFAVPAISVLPLKIFAVESIAMGHVFAGVAGLFAAKTLALGVTAFLFDHCREKLLQMPWFARFYSLVLYLRAWAHALVAPARERAEKFLAAIHARAFAVFRSGNLRIARKIARLRDTARRGRAHS